MNNLEWLYEHDRDALIDGMTCKNQLCNECKFGLSDGCHYEYCALDDREWLMAQHEDANDDFTPENDVSTDDVDANDENDALDSREKLEADVRKWCGMYPYQVDMVWVWLNRQAAITSKEWCWTNDSLQEQVNMLTEQRDHYIELFHEQEHAVYELKRKLEAATDANTDYRDEWHRVCAERANLARDLGNAMAERDRYRELCSKLLDAADDMRRVRDQFDAFTEVD